MRNIYVENLPPGIRHNQLRPSFVAPLRECGILDFHCHIPKHGRFAFVTVLNPAACQRFLSLYGVPKDAPRRAQPRKHVICQNARLRCKPGNNEPTEFEIKALELEASKRTADTVITTLQEKSQTRKFALSEIHCGMWDYDDNSQLVFVSENTFAGRGLITFGSREAIVLVKGTGFDMLRMDMSYYSCDNVILDGRRHEQTLTFTLHYSPKFYRVTGVDALDEVTAGMSTFSLQSDTEPEVSISKSRLLGFNEAHQRIAGACRVYRIRLSENNVLAKVDRLLESSAKMPAHLFLTTPLARPRVTFHLAYSRLDTMLTDTAQFGHLPFQIKFQFDRIARSGFLPPLKVIRLLPAVRDLLRQIGPEGGQDAVAYALRKLTRRLPLPGPDTYEQYTVESLETDLTELANSYDASESDNPYELVKRHQHINLIHKVMVTPTGIYLEGPDPEPTNRVLRQHPHHTHHFIRVVLCDEDGASVRYDPLASQRAIYDDRFRVVLNKSIVIAGMAYEFLGFSHSALRSHSCWFMAPIPAEGTIFIASLMLKRLGNFEIIRAPAKCAARIGQNFTDTNDTIDISPSSVGDLALVERNGRDFSDGVGTISKDLLVKVWDVYGKHRALKPTALQIRFQGAKGMISLDKRLKGEQMLLRSNMRKFETEISWKLEICGAAFKPLPVFLNRQLIKILEDLKVPWKVFFDLQGAAIDRLRYMTESPINAAHFLRRSVSQATQVSSLIEHLAQIGLDYHNDNFLCTVAELAVVTELRDMKYRGRIPVNDAMTLYGIMDETGYLKEGQVFVVTERQAISEVSAASNDYTGGAVPGGKQVLIQDAVVITRSPAMHPGDVQFCDAVDVPEDSPLQYLRNVVVFSQHGERDLPSQLGGGDLDGDTYHVIYDRRLRPDFTCHAAAYDRVLPKELKRAVKASDMTNFFVEFMETDQLGQICNAHMQLADQCPAGTLDAGCLQIAEIASTAVDFSKTGIPVDMKKMPRYDRSKPDFMAPSPRVRVMESGMVELDATDDHEDATFEGIDEERMPTRYYESQKVLGHLYRNIDEQQFITAMHENHQARILATAHSQDVMTKVCDYMLYQASMYGMIYKGYMDFARDVRAGYEDNLQDILYAYGPSLKTPLSEAEVFAGAILGRQGGTQGKPLRELARTMRERYGPVAEYCAMRMIHGDTTMQQTPYLDDLYNLKEPVIEAWPRAIACLVVACHEEGLHDARLGHLQSFKYIAAATCLKEFERFWRTLPRLGPLPKCEV